MVKKEIDSVDLKILRILQDEGRISNLDLSKKIEMSPPPTLRRVRDLEDNGYIDGFRANLDPSKLGYDLVAWIFVSLKNQNEDLRVFVSEKISKDFIERMPGKKAIGDIYDDSHIYTASEGAFCGIFYEGSENSLRKVSGWS